MTTIGTFEAKTHLTQLLGRVARGERILITNRGKPMAMLVPPDRESNVDVKSLIGEMLACRDESGPTVGKSMTLRDMIEEGRRY
jgi:prevent-host-death family protein